MTLSVFGMSSVGHSAASSTSMGGSVSSRLGGRRGRSSPQGPFRKKRTQKKRGPRTTVRRHGTPTKGTVTRVAGPSRAAATSRGTRTSGGGKTVGPRAAARMRTMTMSRGYSAM